MKVFVGDIVTPLGRQNGPAMTVVEASADRSEVVCAWFVDAMPRRKRFPADSLMAISATQEVPS